VLPPKLTKLQFQIREDPWIKGRCSIRDIVALSFCWRVFLSVAAALAIALPTGIGVVRGQAAMASSGGQDSETAHKALQFDVASIKPTPSSDDKTLIQQFPDGTSFRGAPVRMVLRTAFGVEDDRIIGAPTWVNTTRYDIEAKVAPEEARELDKLKGGERNAMLISLLKERFNLKYHHATRELPVYALVVAKGGPRLTKGLPDAHGGPKPAGTEPEDPAKEHYKIMTVPGHIEADSIPMYILADQLTQLRVLGRMVVDKTALTGNYDFSLRWTQDHPLFPMMRDADGLGSEVRAENGIDSGALSIFTAIQEQLGLKLQPEKSSVDVIVIDHIDPPTPN